MNYNWLPSLPATSVGSRAMTQIQAITRWGWAPAAVSAAGMGSEMHGRSDRVPQEIEIPL